MTNYLITGGAGFVGSNLANYLAKNPKNNVTVVDDLSTGNINFVKNKKIKFVKADANNFHDISSIFYAGDFDYVYHYAAVVGVQRTLNNPLKVLSDIEGIKNVLDLSKNTGVKRVIFSSSSEVYGEPTEMPQHEETTPLNSRLPYAIVKNVGESFLKSYYQEFGLEYTIFRFFNTYGPRQSSDFVMSKFINAALNNQDITIYGDGKQTRTFCYIEDNLRATSKAAKLNGAACQVVNIGNDKEITINDLAKKIIKATNSSSKIVHLPALKEGDMTRRKPDITKMKDLLSKELTPLETGIKKLVKYKLNA